MIATSIASVAAAGVAGAADTGAPWGHVSQVTVAKGIASVSGDAVDPDSSDPIRVALTLDGHHVQTVTADRFSKTIAKYHPNLGPNHGYTADVPLPDGRHQLCVIALNVGDGTNTELGCAPVEGANDPVGAILSADRAATGTQLTVTGWTLDPNVVTPITASVVVDGQTVATPTASADATLPPAWSSYGSGHGFTATIPISASAHTVCVTGGNLGAGADADLGCRDVAAFVTAPGIPPKIAAKSTSTSTSVTWIAPENGGAAITRFMVSATSAGEGADTITASAQARSATLSGLRPSTKYSVSVAAVNTAGTGQSATTTVETTAAPVVHRTHPPRHHRHHRLRHTHRHHRVHRHHRTHRHHHARRHHSVHRTHRHHRVHRTHRHHHARRHHTVHRSHRHHRSQHGTIPLQRTPAPVSTSHYLRNLTGNAAHDTHVMRVMGATDARYNPSGHRYLVLQDIGAQYGNGVILSATVKYVSYGDLVKSLKAYVSGYRSAQKSRAPLTLAIGTNNDGRVSRSAGRAWANRVVDPVRAFAGKYHVRVAGADDIEPGFTAGVGASRAWLRGYLSATKAEFVFNGSADGCPTGRGSRCNNGWTVGDLHFLSGGAAPGQIISLPQIYNTAMPLQWRVISGVGTHKVRFGGPLTEYTACRQVGSCSSASNVSAWSMLFHVLAQRPRTAQRAMPYGTDLRIN